MSFQLYVLTLNVWGIPYVSQDKHIRINAIADQLVEGTYDVVSLQEVWSNDDYELIKLKTKDVLPYSHYFHSGVFGSGLAIFSRYPILTAFFHAWSVNGYMHRIQHGDWYGGKGIGMCKISVKDKIINIYIAHLHAEYDNENDDYKAHRVIQAFDTAQFIKNTQNDAVLQILAGDLNIEPHDVAFKLITKTCNLIDSCSDPEVKTNECPKNSYTTPTTRNQQKPVGIRIDHILFRPRADHEATVMDYQLPLPKRIPGHPSISFSDHEAVFARIQISEKEKYESEKDEFGSCENKSDASEALKESISICDASLGQLKTSRMIYTTIALLLSFLLLVLMDLLPPRGLKTLDLILKFVLSVFIILLIGMATVWNVMEKNALLSGKLSMEIILNNILNENRKRSNQIVPF